MHPRSAAVLQAFVLVPLSAHCLSATPARPPSSPTLLFSPSPCMILSLKLLQRFASFPSANLLHRSVRSAIRPVCVICYFVHPSVCSAVCPLHRPSVCFSAVFSLRRPSNILSAAFVVRRPSSARRRVLFYPPLLLSAVRRPPAVVFLFLSAV